MQVVIALDTLTVFSSDSSKQTENCITIRLKAVSPLIVFAGCLLPHGKSSQQFQNEGVTSALFKEMRADIYCSLKQLLYSASVIGPLQQLSLKFKSNKDSYDFVYGYLVTTQDVQTKDTGKEEIWQQLNTVNQSVYIRTVSSGMLVVNASVKLYNIAHLFRQDQREKTISCFSKIIAVPYSLYIFQELDQKKKFIKQHIIKKISG